MSTEGGETVATPVVITEIPEMTPDSLTTTEVDGGFGDATKFLGEQLISGRLTAENDDPLMVASLNIQKDASEAARRGKYNQATGEFITIIKENGTEKEQKGQFTARDAFFSLQATANPEANPDDASRAQAQNFLETLDPYTRVTFDSQETTWSGFWEAYKAGQVSEGEAITAKLKLVGRKVETSAAKPAPETPEESPLTIQEFHNLCEEYEINPNHFDHIATLIGRAQEEDPKKILGEIITHLKKNPLPEEAELKFYQAVFKKLTGENPDPKIQNPSTLIVNLATRKDAQEKFGHYFPFEPDWRYRLSEITSRKEAQLTFSGLKKITPSKHTLLLATIFAIPLLDKTVSSEAE